MMNNKTVYVCFVQNGLGILQGEEVISCLIVTQDGTKIDSWLDEQIAEAAENGYTPDEDVNKFKGACDYTLTVSKGNEEDGYDFYSFVCRATCIE